MAANSEVDDRTITTFHDVVSFFMARLCTLFQSRVLSFPWQDKTEPFLLKLIWSSRTR